MNLQKDSIKELFNIQKEFTKKFLKKKYNLTIEQIRVDNSLLVRFTKDYILSLIKESTELLDEIPDWKMHHNEYITFVKDNFLEETIDIMKYLLGLQIIHGFSIDEIVNKFITKSLVVENKFDQHLEIEKLKIKIKDNKNIKIAAIDIDGVLTDFPNCFYNFIKNEYNKNYDMLSRKEFILAKKQYRESGIKAVLPLIDGAKQFIDSLKELKYIIILLTARPYKKYYRIYGDTLLWLKNNNIKYDFIIWQKNKEQFLINQFPMVSFVVDDDEKNIESIKRFNIKAYKFNNNFNEILKNINNE